MWFPVPSHPEPNLLPHTFLTRLEGKGRNERTAGRWMVGRETEREKGSVHKIRQTYLFLRSYSLQKL